MQDITMGMGNFLIQKPKGQRKIKKICFAGDVEVLDMGGGNVLTPRQGNNLPFKLANRNLNG